MLRTLRKIDIPIPLPNNPNKYNKNDSKSIR